MTTLPVHFFTLVLNGQPFVRHHIEQFRRLEFDWHWHVIEGVAELRHDTAWSVPAGGRVPQGFHRDGRSIDGTSEYLDALAAEEPQRVTIYRKPPGVLWDGKREMVNAPLANIRDNECLLWQLDADELWTAEQITAGRQLFLNQPNKTAAYYWCWFFVGPDRVVSTRGGYGNDPRGEWLRTWRYRPGMRWAAHEPPVLIDAQGRNVAEIDPLRHEETERAGLVFQHYAYATLPQVRFKQLYYGYRGAVAGWAELQFAPLPCRLADFFPWVRDETRVDRADKFVTPLVDLTAHDRPRPPVIVIDGIFFQYAASGIARVWWSLLTEWSRTEFAEHIVLVDRAGTMPPIENIRTRVAPAHRYDRGERERDVLQQICDEEGAAVFVSTYYSIPRTTPSLLMIHDMIPEVMGWDMSGYMGLAKVAAIPYASAFVAVSENSKRDLLRFHPTIDETRVRVTPCGVWPNVFRPVDAARVEAFRKKYNFDARPYFLYVGDRAEYKNGGLLLRALVALPNAGDYQIVFTGGAPRFEPELTPLLAALPATTVVRVVGRLADEDLAAAYCGAAALVVTSLYEGFGLPIVEAMACGCPVITTDAGSTREVAGGAAFVIPQNDPAALAAAMTRALDPAERAKLIAAGIENAKRYRWDAMAVAVRDAIEKSAFIGGASAAT